MLRLIQIVATIFVFGVLPILCIAYFSGGKFLEKFFVDQSLSLMGTILAIYIAASSSFIAILMSFEEKKGKLIFINTTKELKENIIFIFCLFIIHFILLTGTPSSSENTILIWTLNGAKTFTFLLFIFALYELSSQLFTVKDKLYKASGNKN